MFEKELQKKSEEIRLESWFKEGDYYSEGYSNGYERGFQEGVEFVYNKAKELKKIGLALQSDMDKTIEQNIALKKELEIVLSKERE